MFMDIKKKVLLQLHNLVMDAIKYLPQLGNRGLRLIEWCKDKLIEHASYIREYGEDMPDVKNWKWNE